ncbi:ABC transporter substrate-binding protein, partial [Saccharothrix sp. MB29]|nr:ABC transporter substrate-binding protein [Saccharothrix sp. MB29]
PPPCHAGYEGTRKKTGLDTSAGEFNTGATCALPRGSATGVGGGAKPPPGPPRRDRGAVNHKPDARAERGVGGSPYPAP